MDCLGLPLPLLPLLSLLQSSAQPTRSACPLAGGTQAYFTSREQKGRHLPAGAVPDTECRAKPFASQRHACALAQNYIRRLDEELACCACAIFTTSVVLDEEAEYTYHYSRGAEAALWRVKAVRCRQQLTVEFPFLLQVSREVEESVQYSLDPGGGGETPLLLRQMHPMGRAWRAAGFAGGATPAGSLCHCVGPMRMLAEVLKEATRIVALSAGCNIQSSKPLPLRHSTGTNWLS